MLRCCLALAASVTFMVGPASAEDPGPTPRAFGYTVGDRVSRHIPLQLPAGMALDESALPSVGGRGRALELQRVQLHRGLTGAPESLQLDYQVFLAPPTLRVLEMPAVELRFTGGARPQTLRIDAWPVMVGPLTPADAPTREGLGELRPDLPPPLIDTAPQRHRLAAMGAVAALLLAYLAHVYLVMPWASARRQPFRLAWAALRHLPDQPDTAQHQQALSRLHGALNATAGEALFAPGIARFVARRPAFAPLQREIERFFGLSQAVFFAGDTGAAPGHWLRDFCRACRDAERGAA